MFHTSDLRAGPLRLPVTKFVAGVCGVIFVVLSSGVIALRRGHKIANGTGKNKTLERRVRGHGNFCENAPLAILLLGLCEANNALPLVLLKLMGATFLAARVMHGYAFWSVHKPTGGLLTGRVIGTVFSQVCILTLALALLLPLDALFK